MKYFLFACDKYYPGGTDLAAVSDDMQKLIDYAPSLKTDYKEVFEMIEGVGLVCRWASESGLGGDVQVAFL